MGTKVEYKTRYFNEITYVDDSEYLKKSSSNVEKLLAEYKFYYQLPSNLQKYFVRPFGYEVDLELKTASYLLQRYPIKDVANLYINEQLSTESFKNLLSRLSIFLEECPKAEKDASSVADTSEKLVIDKSRLRLEMLESNLHWRASAERAALIASSFGILNLADRLESAYVSLSRNRRTWVEKISHGDMCFSNILWSEQDQIVRLIDPRGGESLYLDEYYDLAKINHSLEGYDAIIYDKYALDFHNLKIVFDKNYSENFYTIFKKFLEARDIDFNLQRIYSASMFLSMVPSHFESTSHIAAFLLLAHGILDSLGF